MGEITKKIEGGKLLRLKAEQEHGKISRISIEGDFFAYPETVIGEIEHSLRGIQANESTEYFQEIISKILNEKDARIVGVGSHDIASALKEALK